MTDLMNVLLLALGYALVIPNAFICILPVKKQLAVPLKKLAIPLVVSLTVLSIIMAFLEVYTSVNSDMLFAAELVFMLFLYFRFVNESRLKLLYVFSCTVAVMSIGTLIGYFFEAHLNPTGNYNDPFICGLVVQWVYVGILLVVYVSFLCKRLVWIIENMKIKSVWFFVWITPMLCTVCSIVMVPVEYKNINVGKVMLAAHVMCFTLFVLFFVCQVLFYRISKAVIERAESDKRAHLLEIQSGQYENLKTYMEQSARLRHDFRHTIRTISALADSEQYDEMKEYIREYNRAVSVNRSQLLFCKHVAANAVLGYYAELAAAERIAIDWRVSLPCDINVSDVDLCVVLGNLLENAIHACAEVPEEERYINLSVDNDEPGEIYLVTANSFNGDIRVRNGIFASTKKQGSAIGLSSVAATAEKYNGQARFYADGKVFHAEIMLSLE